MSVYYRLLRETSFQVLFCGAMIDDARYSGFDLFVGSRCLMMLFVLCVLVFRP